MFPACCCFLRPAAPFVDEARFAAFCHPFLVHCLYLFRCFSGSAFLGFIHCPWMTFVTAKCFGSDPPRMGAVMTHDDGRLHHWEREAIAWYLKGKGAAKGDGKGDLGGYGMKGDGPGSVKGEGHGTKGDLHSMPDKGTGKGKKGPPQELPSASRASVARSSMPPPEPSVPPGKAAAPKAARSKESTPAGGIRPKARPDAGLPRFGLSNFLIRFNF